MRVLLADNHILFREGLIGLLSRDPEIEIVDTTGLAREAIEKTDFLKPDILLLEMNLPDASGLEVLKAVYSKCPDVHVIILTMQMTDDLLLECVENGAKGYLLKDIPVNQLIESLKGVMRQETAFKRTTIRRLIDRLAQQNHKEQQANDFDQLTDRELDVLELIRQGHSNIEIAQTLKISENTAKAHVRKILDKLKLKNRREVRKLALRQGLPNHLEVDAASTSLTVRYRVKKR